MNRILPPKVNRRTRRRYHNGTGDSLSLQWGASDHRCCNFLISGGKVLQRGREDLVSGVLRERLVRWEVSERGEDGIVSVRGNQGSLVQNGSGITVCAFFGTLSLPLFLPDPTFFFKYYLVLSLLPVRLLPSLPHTLDRQRLRPRRRLVKMAKRIKLGKVTTVSAPHRVSVSHWGTTVRDWIMLGFKFRVQSS